MTAQIADIKTNPSDETILLGPLAVRFLISGEKANSVRGFIAQELCRTSDEEVVRLSNRDACSVRFYLDELNLLHSTHKASFQPEAEKESENCQNQDADKYVSHEFGLSISFVMRDGESSPSSST